MRWKLLGKYFLHGILFSVIFLVLSFAWIFLEILLVSFGYIIAFIGFIIGMALLFLIEGVINTILGVKLWNVGAETETWYMFFHGATLFILLTIVGLITFTLPNLVFPGIATLVITFIVGIFLNGVIGRRVATWFGHEVVESGEEEKINED